MVAAKSSATREMCFNCDNSKTCIFYPHVETIIRSDALAYGFTFDNLWWIGACPYCTDETRNLPPEIWILM